MVATDTMAIGGSDIARDLLRVRLLDALCESLSLIVSLQQMEEMSEYKSYKTITLHDDPAANCLWVNETVLHLPSDHRYGESIRVSALLSILLISELRFALEKDVNQSSWSIDFSC